MAWKFLDETKSANKKYREEKMQLINSWWAHFQNRRKNIEAFLDGRANMDLEDFMADCLQSIDENLMWEFGADDTGHYQLVITPETERYLRPLVDTIIASAPNLSNWSFFAYRQPHGLEDTAVLVKEQTGIELSSLAFEASLNEENLIDLVFAVDQGSETLDDAVFMATEYLLGEEILDRWIGDIDITIGRAGSFSPMSALPNNVADMMNSIKSSLPAQPLASLRASLETHEITVEEHEDGDDDRDVLWARTLHPKVWQAAHGDAAFDSCRFSKHNEKFCYLRLDGTTAAEKLNELEAKINDALGKESLGCTLGTARGQRFGYIDLCLTDPLKAIPILKSMQTQCQLQFFDADWADETVAI